MNQEKNKVNADNAPNLNHLGRGVFDFRNPLFSNRLVLEKSLDWTEINPRLYRTQSLRAAAKFRRYADDKTAELFNTQVFTKHYKSPSLPPLPFLDLHQRQGIRWVLQRSRSYLAHAPGAGKTAQAIVASLLSEGTGPTLFIVPPSLTLNWEREIFKFTEWCGIFPTIGIVPTSDKKENMAWRADFIICPDSMLTRDWVYDRLSQIHFKFLAVDEASRFKEPLAERSLALYGGNAKRRHYRGLFQKVRHTVFLDGSPMPNRPMELWAPVYALAPETIDCMDQHEFGFRYCGARQNPYGHWEFRGASRQDELHEKLKSFMHVVTEAELSHPERLRSILVMNKDTRTAQMKKWERQNLSSISFSGEATSQGAIATHRKNLGVSKIPWISGYVSDRLRIKNESILLFAWHREVCLGLAERLKVFNPKIIMGGVNANDREKTFADFQSAKIKLIIGNISAMGRGHNLQRADRIVFGEFSWTDELNLQCEKRASRRGRAQEKFVRCDYVVAPHSMDEIVLQSVFTKAQNVKRVVG